MITENGFTKPGMIQRRGAGGERREHIHQLGLRGSGSYLEAQAAQPELESLSLPSRSLVKSKSR